MEKKSKLNRWGSAVMALVCLAVFQASSDHGCAACNKTIEDALTTEYGTIKVINYLSENFWTQAAGSHVDAVKGDNDYYFAAYFSNEFTDQSGVYTKKVIAGIYLYRWHTYLEGAVGVAKGGIDKSGSGRLVVPPGGTVTLKLQ